MTAYEPPTEAVEAAARVAAPAILRGESFDAINAHRQRALLADMARYLSAAAPHMLAAFDSEVDDLRRQIVERARGGVVVRRERDEARAEVARLTRVVEAVEALADEWEMTDYRLPPGYPMTVNAFCSMHFKHPLRAALAADRGTEGSGS